MQSRAAVLEPGTATVAAIETHGFGKPQIILPRLGQGLFRILVTDAYSRRCAITGERTLPVLEAAHIKPYSLVKRHELPNGLLMRSDLHRLLDEGYLTVDPGDRCVLVSKGSERNSRTGRTTTNSKGRHSESQTKHGRNPHWRIWNITLTTCSGRREAGAMFHTSSKPTCGAFGDLGLENLVSTVRLASTVRRSPSAKRAPRGQ
jgi:hypothetical protein